MIAGNNISLHELERVSDMRGRVNVGDRAGDIEFHYVVILSFLHVYLKRNEAGEEQNRIIQIPEPEEAE